MVYLTWMVVALFALTGLVLLLFVPGVGVLAAVVLALALVLGAVLAMRRREAGGDTTPDIIERRDEHRARQRRRAH